MVRLPLQKCILKVLPRLHFEYCSSTPLIDGASTIVEMYLEGFTTVSFRILSNIPLVSGASVIVETYLDGFAATVCVVFFKFIICRRHISLRNCIMKVLSRYYTPSNPVHSVSTTILSHLWFLFICSVKNEYLEMAKSSNHCGNCQCQNEYFYSISALFVRAFTLKTRNLVKNNDVI